VFCHDSGTFRSSELQPCRQRRQVHENQVSYLADGSGRAGHSWTISVAIATVKVMPRPLDQRRREELLLESLEYVAVHGLADLSLRPLARALGTSDRMLLHYFGTKENLIGQALVASRPDIPRLVGDATPKAVADQARALWQDLMTGGEQEPRVRLLLEVMALSMTQRSRYAEHAKRAVTDWIRPLTEGLRAFGLPAGEAEARASALVSGLRGIALDFFVTGDRIRATNAAGLLIDTLTSYVVTKAID
jgi:AcrR family transcriptional regulator